MVDNSPTLSEHEGERRAFCIHLLPRHFTHPPKLRTQTPSPANELVTLHLIHIIVYETYTRTPDTVIRP